MPALHQEVDELDTHGLSCTKIAGHHSRHAAINSNIQRSPETAQIPSTQEPMGLSRDDGNNPMESLLRCGSLVFIIIVTKQ